MALAPSDVFDVAEPDTDPPEDEPVVTGVVAADDDADEDEDDNFSQVVKRAPGGPSAVVLSAIGLHDIPDEPWYYKIIWNVAVASLIGGLVLCSLVACLAIVGLIAGLFLDREFLVPRVLLTFGVLVRATAWRRSWSS